MSIDDRIPREIGKGALPDHPAIKTPWDKLISFHEAYHYALRHNAAIGALFFEVLRILIPDYAERNERLCDINYVRFYNAFASGFNKVHMATHNVPPFVKGSMIAPLFGDSGDERLCMFGRVNDYGSFRVEKELDNCPFEIQGSEVCRISAYITEAIGDTFCTDGERKLEYRMLEARGCGDLHCRFVIENREKYPMPPRKNSWDVFGPIATEDQVLYTPEEKMAIEPQQFRGDSHYLYRNGFNYEMDPTAYFKFGATNFILGANYIIPVVDDMIEKNEVTAEQVRNIFECVFEGAGKMMCADFFAAKGLREWLGVPADVNDGRVLGAFIELLLQVWIADYDIVAFNKKEVIYDIRRLGGTEHKSPWTVGAFVAMWYGMGRTLVGQQWFLERETEGVADDIIRIKIAKKIDKHSR